MRRAFVDGEFDFPLAFFLGCLTTMTFITLDEPSWWFVAGAGVYLAWCLWRARQKERKN